MGAKRSQRKTKLGRLGLVGMLVAFSSCSSPRSAPDGAARPSPSPGPRVTAETSNAPLPDPLPEIAARVNGQPVLMRNVKLIANDALTHGRVPVDRKPFAFRRTMASLIDRELLFEEAIARGMKADDRKVDEAYDQARAGFKEDKAWASHLAHDGLDPQSFRTELRIRYTVQVLLSDVANKVPAEVSDQAAKTYYDANPAQFETGERLRASHILIRVPAETPPGKKGPYRLKAEDVHGRVAKGDDFAALAKQFSEDPGSASKGGELDVFGRSQMVKPFEDAAYALKVGEVSNVVETPFGFHIIKLHERLPGVKASFDEVKDQLKQSLLEERRQKALQALVESLKAKAKIETFLGN